MSQLSPADRKLLLAALAAGRALERSMSPDDHDAFVSSLQACAVAESNLVKRLAELAAKSSLNLGPKHLMALLVPIERLAGRAARDEEFLFHDRDGTDGEISRLEHLVLCENVRSAFNVGAVFRTTETFGGSEVWLSGYTPEPFKTAMGTDTILKTRRFERSENAISEAKSLGYSIVALENSPGATSVEAFQWPNKTLLILGNERFGVDSSTLAACDFVVRIPTRGQKNSLNVGVAFGIAAASWAPRKEGQSSDQLTGQLIGPPLGQRSAQSSISPIGILRGGFVNSQVAPRQGAYSSVAESAMIELYSRYEGRPSNFAQALQDLEGFERAWVVFGFHESQGWNPQVRPPRGDGRKRGLFATRSPHRPNRIGISSVKIDAVDISKLRISISEHDLLEGTPIFDVKPYIPKADAFPQAKAGWVDDIEASAYALHEGREAKQHLEWLEAHGEKRLRLFLNEQLRFQPFDDDRKRIDIEGSGDREKIGPHLTVSFRTWRIDFALKAPHEIFVHAVRSGYSPLELSDEDDPYLDKKLHQSFVEFFSLSKG